VKSCSPDSLKASAPITEMLSDREMLLRRRQPLNAPPPISITLFGIFISTNCSQYSKAKSSIFFIFVLIVALVRLWQP